MQSLSKTIIPAVAIAVSMALAACVTAPTDTTVSDARTAVHAAEANSDVARFDGLDLSTAEKQLANAESATERGAHELADHEAYLAIRTARLAEVRADEAVAQARIASAGGDRARVQLEARTLDAERAKEAAVAAAADANAASQEAAAANDTVRELQSQITNLSLQPTAQGAMLVLTDDYFESGRSDLRPGAGKILDGLAQFLVAHPERRVRVEGHSDNADSASGNLTLSLRRAEAVRMQLVARGVDPLRSEAVAYGPDNPLASNGDRADRHFIRGVEILLSDSRGQIASR